MGYRALRALRIDKALGPIYWDSCLWLTWYGKGPVINHELRKLLQEQSCFSISPLYHIRRALAVESESRRQYILFVYVNSDAKPYSFVCTVSEISGLIAWWCDVGWIKVFTHDDRRENADPYIYFVCPLIIAIIMFKYLCSESAQVEAGYGI